MQIGIVYSYNYEYVFITLSFSLLGDLVEIIVVMTTEGAVAMATGASITETGAEREGDELLMTLLWLNTLT